MTKFSGATKYITTKHTNIIMDIHIYILKRSTICDLRAIPSTGTPTRATRPWL